MLPDLPQFLTCSTCYTIFVSPESLAISLFHHHFSLCLGKPLVFPHTSSATPNKQSFRPFHVLSTSPSSLSASLFCTFSLNLFCISAYFKSVSGIGSLVEG